MDSFEKSIEDNESCNAVKKMSDSYGLDCPESKMILDYLHQNFLKKMLDERFKTFQRHFFKTFHLRHSSDSKIERTFCFVDYGAADALNSLGIYEDIIQKVSFLNKSNYQKINLILGIQDLPTNNWDMVKENIQHNLLSNISDDLLNEEISKFSSDANVGRSTDFIGSNVTIKFCPSSFYNTLPLSMPTNSVDIAFTDLATNWLSSESIKKYDLKISNAIYAWSKYAKPSEMETFKKAAIEDGIQFLKARGMEMKNGGKLLLSDVSRINPQEAKSYEMLRNYANPYDDAGMMVFEDITCLLDEWNQRLGKSDSFSFPIFFSYYKTKEEWEACFAHPEVVETGLVLNHGETHVMQNVIFTNLIEKHCHGKNELQINKDFADAFLKSILSWGHFVQKVFQGNKNLEDEFLEELKEKYLSKNPERYRYNVLYFCEATKSL